MIQNLIGNTPIRHDAILSKRYNANILIKEDFYNPGKSSKDRAAWYMVKDAIQHNKISKGGTFVEASSGNMGISIALIASELNYKSKIFVSASCSDEKIELLKSYGASIERCENSNGLHVSGSTQYKANAYSLSHEDCYFTNQYCNQNNIEAHYETTGPEIWKQTSGNVTHVIVGVGTGGTISGIGRFLKQQNSAIKVYGVEPVNSVYSTFMSGEPVPENEVKFDAIEGIGRTFIPKSFDKAAVNRIFQISKSDSIKAAHAYKEDSDRLVGFSSAALLAALDRYQIQMNFKPDDNVVLFFPDHGDRYINKLYTESYNSQLVNEEFDASI